MTNWSSESENGKYRVQLETTSDDVFRYVAYICQLSTELEKNTEDFVHTMCKQEDTTDERS